MYAALWRILPGSGWLRAAILLAAAVAVLAALAFWVFPWVQEIVNPQDVTVGEG
jgi:hypothetical protein